MNKYNSQGLDLHEKITNTKKKKMEEDGDREQNYYKR